jgi:hypothetical protein
MGAEAEGKKQAGSRVPASSILEFADDALPDNQRANQTAKALPICFPSFSR